MSNSKSDFKVFVSDEILDLRILEEKYTKEGPNILRIPCSQHVSSSKYKKESHTFNERSQITSLEKFAKCLYDTSPNVIQKNKRPKQKSRSKTVDPRFRRSRSPTHNLLASSQSTSELLSNPSPAIVSRSRKESHSTSYLSPTRQSKSEKFQFLKKELKLPKPKKVDFKECQNIHQNSNCFEDDLNSSTQLLETSPYWDDPRLLEKHNVVMKPVRATRIRSAITVPVLSTHSHSRGVVLRHTCLSCQHTSPIYSYDDRTDICEGSLVCNTPRKVKNTFGRAERHASYMVLGSIIGVLLVSVIGFLVWYYIGFQNISATNFLYSLFTSPTPPPNRFISTINYFINCMKVGLNTVLSKIYEILLLPRSVVLNYHRDEF